MTPVHAAEVKNISRATAEISSEKADDYYASAFIFFPANFMALHAITCVGSI